MLDPNLLKSLAEQLVDHVKPNVDTAMAPPRASMASTIAAIFRPYIIEAESGVKLKAVRDEEDRRSRKWLVSVIILRGADNIVAISEGRSGGLTSTPQRWGGELCTGLAGVADLLAQYATAVIAPDKLTREWSAPRLMQRLNNLRPTISREGGYAQLRVLDSGYAMMADIFREDAIPVEKARIGFEAMAERVAAIAAERAAKGAASPTPAPGEEK